MRRIKNQSNRIVYLHYYHNIACSDAKCFCTEREAIKHEPDGKGGMVQRKIRIKVPKVVVLRPNETVDVDEEDPILDFPNTKHLVRAKVLGVESVAPAPKSSARSSGSRKRKRSSRKQSG